MDTLSPPQFHGVHLNDIPVVRDFLHMTVFLYELDFVESKLRIQLIRSGKFAELREYCHTFDIQKTFLLCEQHQYSAPILSLP